MLIESLFTYNLSFIPLEGNLISRLENQKRMSNRGTDDPEEGSRRI